MKKIVSIFISMLKTLLQDGSFKSKKRKIETLCILRSKECCEQCKLQEVGWSSMREKATAWIGLDTFGTVSETVGWGNGPEIYFLHNNCKLSLHTARAKKTKEKKTDQENSEKALQKKLLQVVVRLVILQPSLGLLQLDIFIQRILCLVHEARRYSPQGKR